MHQSVETAHLDRRAQPVDFEGSEVGHRGDFGGDERRSLGGSDAGDVHQRIGCPPLALADGSELTEVAVVAGLGDRGGGRSRLERPHQLAPDAPPVRLDLGQPDVFGPPRSEFETDVLAAYPGERFEGVGVEAQLEYVSRFCFLSGQLGVDRLIVGGHLAGRFDADDEIGHAANSVVDHRELVDHVPTVSDRIADPLDPRLERLARHLRGHPQYRLAVRFVARQDVGFVRLSLGHQHRRHLAEWTARQFDLARIDAIADCHGMGTRQPRRDLGRRDERRHLAIMPLDPRIQAIPLESLKIRQRAVDYYPVIVSHVSPVRAVWFAISAALVAVTLLTLIGPWSDVRWEHPDQLFGMVAIAALVCIFGATVVIALADRREMAEIGLLGSALMAASVMPLVHALVTPDVLFDQTEAFRSAAFLSLPVAVVVSSPLLLQRTAFGRWAARHWRDWTLVSLLGVFMLASVLVFFPDAIVTPDADHALTVVATVGMALALGIISLRQLRYYELGRQRSNLVAAMSMLLLAVTALLPLADTPYTPGFWWLHAAGALGVLGTLIGMAVSRHPGKSTHDALAPLLVRDPLAAFELGLSPVVHAFVSDLALKDQMTRDHVVRTCELAMRVGERFRLSGDQLRDLGLAALLHDVGKVAVPDSILKKSGPLTDAEYAIVKLHSADGERMLAAEPRLVAASRIVRSHHERVDGGGYPDGLSGRDIPLGARIIAACDALDAMTHDRQYRTAMPAKLAFAILREFSGTQWDATVVEQVIAVLPTMPTIAGLDEVGRSAGSPVESGDSESGAPDDIGALLALVDAEF